MDERVIQFRIGVVVLAAAIITFFLVILFGGWSTYFGGHYTVFIRFRQAPGVTVDTPVRKSGVLIGRVSNVTLLEEGGVLVASRIEGKYTLRRNEVCRIASGSLLGDAVLEFVPNGQEQLLAEFDVNKNGRLDSDEKEVAATPLGDSDYLNNGTVASNPLDVLVGLEDDIESAVHSVESAATEIRVFARNLNSAIGNNEDQLRRIMQKSELALEQFHTTMKTVNNVVGDPEITDGFKKSLQEFPGLVTDIRQTMGDARTTLQGFQRMSTKAETNLDNLQKFTEPLGERGERMVMTIDQSLQSVDELLANLAQFSRELNEGEGTLSLLIKDRELYDRLNGAAINIESVSGRLQPIVDNVRILTDKLSRDPSQLGLKGALDRRPHGLKTRDWSSDSGSESKRRSLFSPF